MATSHAAKYMASASIFYKNVLSDSLDIGNGTSEVNVIEQDGKVGLSMIKRYGQSGGGVQVFMTPEQGHELLRGLLEAIDCAERECSRRRAN